MTIDDTNNASVKFGMPSASGFEIYRWDDSAEVEQLVEGDLSIESGEGFDVLVLGSGNFEPGDLALVQTVLPAGADNAQVLFRMEQGNGAGLVPVHERTSTMFAVDTAGAQRSVGEWAFLGPKNELSLMEDRPGFDLTRLEAHVAVYGDREHSQRLGWNVSATDAGRLIFELDEDTRVFTSTAVAYEEVRAAKSLTDRTVIVVDSQDGAEPAVGFVVTTGDERFIVAVTDHAGEFERFEDANDVLLTIRSGTDPELIGQAVSSALDIEAKISPAFDGVKDFDVASLRDFTAHYNDRVLVDTSQEQQVSWNAQLDTFAARTVPLDEHGRPAGDVQRFGVTDLAFPTAASLVAAMEDAGVSVSTESLRQLRSLEDSQDGPRFVGVQTTDGPRLSLVGPSQEAESLVGGNVHSPDGPNWGYSGNGPREMTREVVLRTLGEAGDSSAANERVLAGVVSKLPSEFSFRAKDVPEFLETGKRPDVATTGREIDVERVNAVGRIEVMQLERAQVLETDLDLRLEGLEL